MFPWLSEKADPWDLWRLEPRPRRLLASRFGPISASFTPQVFSMSTSSLRFSAVCLAAAGFLVAPSAAQQLQHIPGAFPNPKRWTEGVECADVDNDGDLDVFFAEGDGFSSAGPKRQNVLIINKFEIAPGTLVDESVARLGVHLSNGKSADTGDVDGDGYIDAMFANAFNTDPPFLYMNVGGASPGFFSFEGVARGFNIPFSSACSNFGDLDNDGDLDVIISDSGSSFLGGSGSRPHLFFNNGAGFFKQNQGALSAPIMKAHMDVQFADVDGDWDLDFIGLNRATTQYLMLNDGAGNFTDASNLVPATSSNVYEAEVGDLDGDSDIDMFFVSLSGFGEGPIKNNFAPSGTLSFTKGVTTGGDDDNEIALFDYDNDGDFDAVVGSLASKEKMLNNDGNGIFSNAAGVFTAISDSTLDITVADLDNDGAYDVISSQGESGSTQWDAKFYKNMGSADTLDPVIVREENVVPGSAGPWVVRSEIRDQVMDDGRNWVGAELDYVVRTAPMTASVSAQGLSFTPSVLVVPAGTTVTWTNNDSGVTVHTVTSSTLNYDFNSGNIPPGGTYSYTFVRPGTYDYICIPHASFGMSGQVIVTAGTSTTTGVTEMGGGGQFRFEMADTSGGTAIDVAYERRFTDWAGNVTVSEPTVVAVAGGTGGGSFTVYGTGASAANYMSISGSGGTKIGNAFAVTTTNITQAGVFMVVSLNQISTPAFGGVLLADFFSPVVPLSFLPASGGSAIFNSAIPNNPGIVGIGVYFQTGISDGSQPGGFGMSDGLELIVGQ